MLQILRVSHLTVVTGLAFLAILVAGVGLLSFWTPISWDGRFERADAKIECEGGQIIADLRTYSSTRFPRTPRREYYSAHIHIAHYTGQTWGPRSQQWAFARFVRIRIPFVAPFAVIAIYPLIYFLRHPLRRHRWGNSGRCTHCGYDLTGNASGICPECGKDTERDYMKDLFFRTVSGSLLFLLGVVILISGAFYRPVVPMIAFCVIGYPLLVGGARLLGPAFAAWPLILAGAWLVLVGTNDLLVEMRFLLHGHPVWSTIRWINAGCWLAFLILGIFVLRRGVVLYRKPIAA